MTLSVADLAAKVYGTGAAAASTGNALSDMGAKSKRAADTVKTTADESAKAAKAIEELRLALQRMTLEQEKVDNAALNAQVSASLQERIAAQYGLNNVLGEYVGVADAASQVDAPRSSARRCRPTC